MALMFTLLSVMPSEVASMHDPGLLLKVTFATYNLVILKVTERIY